MESSGGRRPRVPASQSRTAPPLLPSPDRSHPHHDPIHAAQAQTDPLLDRCLVHASRTCVRVSESACVCTCQIEDRGRQRALLTFGHQLSPARPSLMRGDCTTCAQRLHQTKEQATFAHSRVRAYFTSRTIGADTSTSTAITAPATSRAPIVLCELRSVLLNGSAVPRFPPRFAMNQRMRNQSTERIGERKSFFFAVATFLGPGPGLRSKV